MNIGNKNISSLFFGSKAVQSVFLGNREIYYSSSIGKPGFYNNNGELLYSWEQLKNLYQSYITDSAIYGRGVNRNGVLSDLSGYLILPKSVKILGDYAFQNCSNLTKIYIPGVKTISNACFNGCSSLTEILNQDELVTIENTAFKSCTALSEFVCGDKLIELSGWAFTGCSNLKSVILSDSIESVIWSSTNCPKLSNYIISNSILYLPSKTNKYFCAYHLENYRQTNIILNDNTRVLNSEFLTDMSGTSSIYHSQLYIPPHLVNLGEKTATDSSHISACQWQYITSNNSNYIVKNNVALVKVSDNSLIKLCSTASSIVPADIGVVRSNSCAYCTWPVFPETFTGNVTLVRGSFANLQYNSLTIPAYFTSLPTGLFGAAMGTHTIYIPNTVNTIEGSLFSSASGDKNIIVNCQAALKPAGWASGWDWSINTVNWGVNPPQS